MRRQTAMLVRMSGLRAKLAESAAAFRGNFENPQLRRLQLAGIGSVVGQWAYSIAVSVYAYEAGGAKAVGVVDPRPDDSGSDRCTVLVDARRPAPA